MNTVPAHSVLLVEDDLRLADLVSRYLETQGFRMTIVSRGDEVVELVQRDNPDLVILDLGLPGEDGFNVCRRLRPTYTNPILILMHAITTSITCWPGAGGDDYVIKPVERECCSRELCASQAQQAATPDGGQEPDVRSLLINIVSPRGQMGREAITLSRNEFDLLVHLASHPGEIQSREMLFKTLYNRDYDRLDRMLDIRISRLRKKLGDDARTRNASRPSGAGYLFVPDAW